MGELMRSRYFHRANKLRITSVPGLGFLANEDALEYSRSLRAEIADLVFLDPPFNLGKDYGVGSWLEHGDEEVYEFYLRRVLREMVRILKPGGSLFLYQLPFWASRLSEELQRALEFRHWIAVGMKNGFVRGQRLYPAHYALLYYTKGKPRAFSRPRLDPKYCRHCGGLVRDYGGYTALVEQKGLNLSDLWEDLSPVRHRSRKHRVSNELPPALTDRVVAIAGLPGGVLVDPFVGSGTMLVSGIAAGMQFLGNDLSRRALAVCIKRLSGANR